VPLLILSLLVQISLIVHAISKGKPLWWVGLILFFPVIGSVVYIVLEVLPGTGVNRALRRAESEAVQLVDPHREVRLAQAAFDDVPTMGNRLKLAQAHLDAGAFEEAERHFNQCLTGQFVDDHAALLGHARALVELGCHAEALSRIADLRAVGREGATEALIFARAASALGRTAEAEEAFAFAAPRLPGLEAVARYIRFLRAQGREAEALVQLKDLDSRLAKVPVHFKQEANRWRALAVASD
jgi:hypothetical protein